MVGTTAQPRLDLKSSGGIGPGKLKGTNATEPSSSDESDTSEQTTSSENSSSQESTDSEEESEEESSESSTTDSEPPKPPVVKGQPPSRQSTPVTKKPSKGVIANRSIRSQTDSNNNNTKRPTSAQQAVLIKRRRGVRRPRPLTICLTHCRYDLVRSISQKYGLIEVTDDTAWNIYWTDWSISNERASEMRRFQMVNHFPGMSEICRKDLLAKNLNRMKRMYPEDYNIYPMSWCLPNDNAELQAYSQSRRGKTYICKPEMGCQGRGIFLVKNLKDLNPFGRVICQLYIQKPFLIDHLKFDLRIYVLITSCDPLRVYVHKEGLARFATAKYRQPTQNNAENSYMHLTNYAVNKFSRDFVDDEESGTKRKLTTVFKWMRDRGCDLDTLQNDIDDVIMKTILAGQPTLKHHYRTCFPNHDICSACFEILGFDILIDHKLKPYIIEVNHSPSFHTDTKLDHEIKEALLNDTFAMLHIKQIDRVRIEKEDRLRAQERLVNKLAEAKHILEGKNKKPVKGQPSPKEDVSRPHSPPKPDFNIAQFQWEMEHCGGYRLIYPVEGSEKYDKFLTHQICLYHETTASQARANLTRAQIDENNLKKQLDEQKRFGGMQLNKANKVRPESATSVDEGKKKKKKAPTIKVDDGSGFGFRNCFVVSEEECERVRCLMQRGMLIRSLGIELQAYNLLTHVGNLKKSDHDEFRRKHGFNINSQRPPLIRLDSSLTYPSNSNSNSPSRQELSENEKALIGELKSPSNKPPNPGGHQSDYLRAKWVAYQSTEVPISFNPSTSMFTMRWQADRNLRLNGTPSVLASATENNSLPGENSFGKRAVACGTESELSLLASAVQDPANSTNGPLPTQNTKEVQQPQRYNMEHNRKWFNALASFRQNPDPLTLVSGGLPNSKPVLEAQKSPRQNLKGPVKPSTAVRKWMDAASPYLTAQPGMSSTWMGNVPYFNNRKPNYPISRFRSAHEPSGTVPLGRVIPTYPKRVVEGYKGPSLESAAVIFPRRGNNKMTVSAHTQLPKRNNSLGIRPIRSVPGQVPILSPKVQLSTPTKNDGDEHAPLFLKGFHISPNTTAALKL